MLALSAPELLTLLTTLPPDRTAFVWGPPGIGKSALVREAAQSLGLPCVTLLGTQLAPEDLIGIPRVREVMPQQFATEFCPPRAILRSTPFVMFIDELNSAVPDVQKAFYSLILDRRLGDYQLPAGSRVLAAGNRIEDRALVRPMASALANRMVHVALLPDAPTWLRWASSAEVHPLVIAFVRARPDRLCESPPSDLSPAYPTPRAWHMLSDTLASTNPALWPALAAGTVGDGAGAEFAAFAQRARLVPSLDDIAAGVAGVPSDPELIYFLGASCLARLASARTEDGELVARVLTALGASSKEVVVWVVDAALSQPARPGALDAFAAILRTSAAPLLVDALRLGRFAREP